MVYDIFFILNQSAVYDPREFIELYPLDGVPITSFRQLQMTAIQANGRS